MIKRLLLFTLIPSLLLLAACSAPSGEPDSDGTDDTGKIVEVYRSPT